MNSLNYYSVFKVPGEHLSQVFPPHLLKNIVGDTFGQRWNPAIISVQVLALS